MPDRIEMPAGWTERAVFQRLSHDQFSLWFPNAKAGLTADEVYTDKAEMKARITVHCEAPGVQTYGGTVSTTTVTITSEQSRTRFANAIHRRVNLEGYPWTAIVDELSLRIMEAVRTGSEASLLCDGEEEDDSVSFVEVTGATLPFTLPSILFGDGGSFKSYLALLWAVEVANAGHPVLYIDWEMRKSVHAERAKLLRVDDNEAKAKLHYVKAEMPIVQEAAALRRHIVKHKIQYAVLDSVGFACDGPIEDSVTANRYFRAVSKLGIGTLHLAHVSKAQQEKEQPRSPFGSSFWHNQSRCTWHLRAESGEDGNVQLELAQRKNNIGRLRDPVPMAVEFHHDRTIIRCLM